MSKKRFYAAALLAALAVSFTLIFAACSNSSAPVILPYNDAFKSKLKALPNVSSVERVTQKKHIPRKALQSLFQFPA